MDGFHPVNVGKVLIGDKNGFTPCTPWGVQVLLEAYGVKTAGMDCVIVGRSNIVEADGEPDGAARIERSCTVTSIAWSHA